ncbi:MAG: cytochrome c3 family protein [Nitrospirota bacterium]|nr:cytochrome c3 family protein [Nitrospirota bacterium]
MVLTGPSANRIFLIVMMICFTFTLFGCAQAAVRTRTRLPLPLPEIKKDCSTCHIMEGARRTDSVKKQGSALCLDCHPDRIAPQEHKVDIVPTMQVKGLPLLDGKMTCLTCHDPHSNKYDALLRRQETDLCLVCHPY